MELLDSPCPHQNVAEIHRPESPDAAAASVAVAPQIASPKPGRHPVFKGIRCRSGKWVSEIREPKKTTRIWLGTYATAEMAAAAYDVATLALKGPEASVNFPHLSSYYPLPASQAAGDIRAAAACAASFSLIKCDGGGCVGVQIQLPTTNEGTNLEELISMENDEIGEGIESRTPLSGYETEALLSPYAPPPEAPFNKVVEAVSEGVGIEIPALLFPNETENETGEASPMEEFVDEEELFEMPKLLDEMAEGMMVSPPRMKLATYDEEGVEEEMPESLCVDDNLWSFSVLMQTYN